MPVFSLPSPYGIGSFGKEFFSFLDFLAKSGNTCLQVLPLNPTSYGDSPYQSPSSFGGNPYFIDLEILHKKGLLTEEELKNSIFSGKRVDYGWLFGTRYDILRKAFSRFEKSKEYYDFLEENSFWVEDYSYFMALKVHNSFKDWREWQEEYKFYDKAKEQEKKFEGEKDFWKFLQFEFSIEWQDIKDYAHKKGISILGDMPIYVALDSVEVWSKPQEFLLDNSLNPTLVAAVPPDYFCEDGQLWGNPVYDWERMKKENYSWWVERVRRAKSLFDIIRIDHFRAFAGYYVVRYGDANAKKGWWNVGVGIDLFRTIEKQIPDIKIIAEDLGVITPDVVALLKKAGFPGMKVLQFAFDSPNSVYLPGRYKTENCVVYTGTHDNLPTLAWFESLAKKAKKRMAKETGYEEGMNPVRTLIESALNSKANLAIIPIQDYIEGGAETRINEPATPSGNWAWRIDKKSLSADLEKEILELITASGRN